VGGGGGGGGKEGGGDLLARKKYAMPECVSVEIGMQTHSKCIKTKTFHNVHI